MPPVLVSVVVPCFNPTEFLFEALASIRAQTHSPIEVIVVNDGTTSEGGLDILNQISHQVETYIEQPNRGLAAARNTGFRAARGDFILPLDCDDLVQPGFVAACLEALNSNPDAAFAYAECQVFGTTNYVDHLGDYNLYKLLDQNNLVYASLIRRHDWEAAGGYDESMRYGYEDWEFWLHLGARGRFGKRVEEPLFHYRKHGPSLLDTARAHHQSIVDYIHAKHPDLYSYENRARVKARWSPSVNISHTGKGSGQTLLDCSEGMPAAGAPALLIDTSMPLDLNSAELAALAVWAGNRRVRLRDGSVACSREGLVMTGEEKAFSPAGSSARAREFGTIHRHLLNAGLLSWRQWREHPLQSVVRLIPLRIKESINQTARRPVFDLSFYLQFRPQSVMVGDTITDPLDYMPRLGSKRRICLITPHLGPGGAEKVLREIAGSLDRHLYEISLLATNSNDDSWRNAWSQAVDLIYDLREAVPPERMASALLCIARNWQYDFVLLQNSLHAYSALPAIRRALPSAVIIDLVHSIDADWDITSATAPVSRALDLRVAVSEQAAARLRSVEPSGPEVRVIRSGINTEQFPARASEALTGPHRILFAARLDPVKRPQLLVPIAESLGRLRPERDFRFVVAGDGSEAASLRKSVARTGLSSLFEFMGHVPDLAPVIQRADLVILTSQNEGIPLVILEAMASGKAVVASRVGALSEAVVDQETGILIDTGSGEEVRFAAAVHALLDDYTRRQSMGRTGRKLVEKLYDQETARCEYRRLFERTASYIK